jgi:hypothetical protein
MYRGSFSPIFFLLDENFSAPFAEKIIHGIEDFLSILKSMDEFSMANIIAHFPFPTLFPGVHPLNKKVNELVIMTPDRRIKNTRTH